MKKHNPNEPMLDALLNLLTALDGGLLDALQAKGSPILVVTAIPASAIRDDGDGCDEDEDEELEDGEGCCPEYEPASDGTGRCVYTCPQCGACLRDYIGEELE
ncbi:MAG TPA: hypothetical protein IAC31_09620 [Candidatus Faecousia intestinigallinarum]|nr:hypothetical protein [Candidatus Faecousia intestinigallinarum]